MRKSNVANEVSVMRFSNVKLMWNRGLGWDIELCDELRVVSEVNFLNVSNEMNVERFSNKVSNEKNECSEWSKHSEFFEWENRMKQMN